MTLKASIAFAVIVPRFDKKGTLPNPPDNHRSQEKVLGGYRVVRPTLLYISSEAVIPAPHQVRAELQQESRSEILDSPVSSTGQA